MNELAVHPNVYATGPNHGLIALLERVWVREHTLGDGIIYVVSAFANYNGGVRFFPVFRDHVEGRQDHRHLRRQCPAESHEQAGGTRDARLRC